MWTLLSGFPGPDRGHRPVTLGADLAAGQRPQGLLARAMLLPTESIHYEMAAALLRSCRTQGETVRKMIDCLIAAIAIRNSATLLHADHDFEVLARCTPLQVVHAVG